MWCVMKYLQNVCCIILPDNFLIFFLNNLKIGKHLVSSNKLIDICVITWTMEWYFCEIYYFSINCPFSSFHFKNQPAAFLFFTLQKSLTYILKSFVKELQIYFTVYQINYRADTMNCLNFSIDMFKHLEETNVLIIF